MNWSGEITPCSGCSQRISAFDAGDLTAVQVDNRLVQEQELLLLYR